MAAQTSSSSVRLTCPVPRSKVVELYFLEHRAKLLDLAAFLDRLDRAEDDTAGDDFRVAALRRAAGILVDGVPDRARRILELFSDRSTEPIARAPMKGALGAAECAAVSPS
ncbi:MAG TPA: hypothetical protein PKC43_01330 [Phycisphaerales bacterium]|nr:hypothetical protein [Phycisphaerales bacterium]HMP36067.1 hypothetical protein [Phycisphaerales bacterium]